jgi:Asp-tRNA(Asn)/Glu-tRNA(Gln) amidotransferase A subunit family amidase
VRTLEGAGTEVIEVDKVFDEDPVGHWLTLSATYNLRLLERYRGTDVWEQLDPGLVASMEWSARSVSAVDLARAEDQAHLLNLRLVELFHRVPLLLTPAVAGLTPPSGGFGTIDGADDPNWVRFTYPFNLTRSPAGVVCAGFTAGGLPVGLQVVGPQHGDAVVLRAMALLEDLLAVDRTPPLG